MLQQFGHQADVEGCIGERQRGGLIDAARDRPITDSAFEFEPAVAPLGAEAAGTSAGIDPSLVLIFASQTADD